MEVPVTAAAAAAGFGGGCSVSATATNRYPPPPRTDPPRRERGGGWGEGVSHNNRVYITAHIPQSSHSHQAALAHTCRVADLSPAPAPPPSLTRTCPCPPPVSTCQAGACPPAVAAPAHPAEALLSRGRSGPSHRCSQVSCMCPAAVVAAAGQVTSLAQVSCVCPAAVAAVAGSSSKSHPQQ